MRSHYSKRVVFLFLTTLLLFANLSYLAKAQTDETVSASEIVLILDASGSMWGQIEGENKISIAKTVLKNIVGELPNNSEVGLIAYGHREKGDCKDIETIVQPGPLDKAAINKQIDALNPKGKTPITDSVLMAFDLVKANENATTVILVSDGIETCGGDPCQAVKEAKEAGINFIMHVVGFDVSDVDVSELECAAQAGGGLYLSAQNASELTEALETAVEIPAELPTGKLSVKVTGGGKLQDAYLVLTNTKTGEEIRGQRTYSDPKTNPRVLSLPDGVYDLEVRPQGMQGVQHKTLTGIEIKEGEVVEKEVAFGFGGLSIKVVRNDKLTDSSVSVYEAHTENKVAVVRTYKDAHTNPNVIELDPGIYNVEVKALEIDSSPVKKINDLDITSGETVEKIIDFSSGTIKIGALQGEKFLDAVVKIADSASGEKITQGRTYKNSDSNPKAFELPPGIYNVVVEVLGIEGKPSLSFDDIKLEASQTVEKTAQFTSGTLKVGAFQGEKLLDAVVQIINPDNEEIVGQGRTYKASDSNPKTFELPPGTYDVVVKALSLDNKPTQEYKGVEIKPGETVFKEAQFAGATIRIGSRNGEKLVDATIQITNSTTGEIILRGRTYVDSNSNPKVFEITPGIYDITVTALNMSTKPSQEFSSIELKAGDTIEEIVQFPRGIIKVFSIHSGENLKSPVKVNDAKTGEQLAYGYTDSNPKGNPKEFILPPGSYEIIVMPKNIEGASVKIFNVDLEDGGNVELKADFSN